MCVNVVFGVGAPIKICIKFKTITRKWIMFKSIEIHSASAENEWTEMVRRICRKVVRLWQLTPNRRFRIFFSFLAIKLQKTLISFIIIIYWILSHSLWFSFVVIIIYNALKFIVCRICLLCCVYVCVCVLKFILFYFQRLVALTLVRIEEIFIKINKLEICWFG